MRGTVKRMILSDPMHSELGKPLAVVATHGHCFLTVAHGNYERNNTHETLKSRNMQIVHLSRMGDVLVRCLQQHDDSNSPNRMNGQP